MQQGEDQLTRSIAAAFDRLPEPEAARLEALERRLSLRATSTTARRTPRIRFWWLIAGLVATGAAAWWGGQYFGRTDARNVPSLSAPAVDKKKELQDRPRSERRGRDEPARIPSADTATDSQTIYRREVY